MQFNRFLFGGRLFFLIFLLSLNFSGLNIFGQSICGKDICGPALSAWAESNNSSMPKSADVPENELSALEQKLLQKTYPNDPLGKRLQRLELLTYGATQYGSYAQRWHNIERYLHNKNSARQNFSQANNQMNISKSINELEKYVFKKSYPSLSTSTRLDKLESKLFGQASPSLAAEKRIARLQRTLGIPDTEQMAQTPYQAFPPGMRGLPPGMQGFPPGMQGFGGSPYFAPMQPGGPRAFGYGFGFNQDDMQDPDLGQFESQMGQLFNEMQRQMQDQMQMPDMNQMPGYGGPNNGMPHYGGPNNGAPKYHVPKNIPQPRLMPETKIPAYNDPNFI